MVPVAKQECASTAGSNPAGSSILFWSNLLRINMAGIGFKGSSPNTIDG